MLKRLFDILFSGLGLLLLAPFFVFIALLIWFGSKGGVFFLQTRVGKNNKDFQLFKFRTMLPDADKKGLLTIGGRDPRITKIGYYLRKYKIDELPQLINVLLGSMSLVGPRPEVRKYVSLYNTQQLKVLEAKPGITDYASLEYFSESELHAESVNPEETYISEIMPAKLALNNKYISEQNAFTDVLIILRTIRRIFKR